MIANFLKKFYKLEMTQFVFSIYFNRYQFYCSAFVRCVKELDQILAWVWLKLNLLLSCIWTNKCILKSSWTINFVSWFCFKSKIIELRIRYLEKCNRINDTYRFKMNKQWFHGWILKAFIYRRGFKILCLAYFFKNYISSMYPLVLLSTNI